MTAPRYLSPEDIRQIAEIQPVPREMPAAPFGPVRALWLCRTEGCSMWNKQERTQCKDCGSVRT